LKKVPKEGQHKWFQDFDVVKTGNLGPSTFDKMNFFHKKANNAKNTVLEDSVLYFFI
jgi:hypothetical protein